ncbi:PAS domain-containing protein [candidate division KSB1 bacterium]|nr:PAS domain-containing protein [candidate division KSB1 bacterium]
MHKKNPAPQKTKAASQLKSFAIAGIGASAGGLEAFEIFFSHMPPNSNVAFVIIQHLDSKHKSLMASLLGKYTTMKILEAEDGIMVEPNCIYLNKPDKNIVIINRRLQLLEPEKSHALNLPIDYFFRSLSQDQAENAIGIILSGTGSDGTLGIKAIKGAGGMTMVQDEQQAKYNGMPRSAIDTGLVDYILPVEKMPEELINYLKHPFNNDDDTALSSSQQVQNYLQKIYALIRSHTGNDFSNYKQNTTRRRIERRMAVHQINHIGDYVRYIQQTPVEVEALFKDLLITVTNFFRDPEAFEILKEKVFPELINKISGNSSIRCWIPGCATGEEAYSIAMLFMETMDTLKTHINVQIFATDIDDDAINTARAGIYPEAVAADVSPERLSRFFIKEDDVYKIKKQVREMVVFATQNLIKDPPFSKLHFISCRNLLIYLDQVLQKKLLPLFHYTLQPNGILFLGSSESIGKFTDLFSPVNTKWKIFKSKGIVIEHDGEYPAIPAYDRSAVYPQVMERKMFGETNIRELAQKLIIEEYSPSHVLINDKLEILYFSGATEKYLNPPIGEPSFNILKLARPEIVIKLSTTLHKAIKNRSSVIHKNVIIEYHGSFHAFDIIVRPMNESTANKGIFIVIFSEKNMQNKMNKKATTVPQAQDDNQRVAALELELNSTKEFLQATIEELETSNEELKSTNEELQSTNEELQSTNEELETSKEELQSTNEELVTINAELQNKVDELSRANNDINNLLASTEIATIFLDTKLRIKRFTPTMTRIFNLIQSDIDRPISDITSNLNYNNFYDDSQNVLRTLERKEVEIQNTDNTWYSMRLAPYRTTENVIDGVVITFVDVTKIKQAEEHSLRLATIVGNFNDAIIIFSLDGMITSWNECAKKMYGYSEEEALRLNIADLAPLYKKQEIADTIEKIKTGTTVKPFKTKRLTKTGRELNTWITITKLTDSSGNMTSISTTERDLDMVQY